MDLKQICVDNWEIKESRIGKVKIPGKENTLKRASPLFPATIDLHSLSSGAFAKCGAGHRHWNPKHGAKNQVSEFRGHKVAKAGREVRTRGMSDMEHWGQGWACISPSGSGHILRSVHVGWDADKLSRRKLQETKKLEAERASPQSWETCLAFRRRGSMNSYEFSSIKELTMWLRLLKGKAPRTRGNYKWFGLTCIRWTSGCAAAHMLRARLIWGFLRGLDIWGRNEVLCLNPGTCLVKPVMTKGSVTSSRDPNSFLLWGHCCQAQGFWLLDLWCIWDSLCSFGATSLD